MNMLKDLFTSAQLENYQRTIFPFNLHLVHEALKEKLKEDPEYEVFAPLMYYKFVELVKRTGYPALLTRRRYYVSNKGNVVSLRGGLPLAIGVSKNRRGYARFNVPAGGNKQMKLLLHRAVACSFVPVIRGLGAAHPKQLHVNHLDGIKKNCNAINLEWCTAIENTEHATLTGLIPSAERHYAIKPVKGKILSGDFKGHQFILIGSKEIKSRGFFKEAVSKCCLGQVATHLNCSFSFAGVGDVSSLPRGLPDEIFNALVGLGKSVKTDILARDVKTGEETIIKGGLAKLLELGFDGSSVSKVINGKLKTHKGHTFKRLEVA